MFSGLISRTLVIPGLFRTFGDEPKGREQIDPVPSIAGHSLRVSNAVFSPACRPTVLIEHLFASETLIHATIVQGMDRAASLHSTCRMKKPCFKQIEFCATVRLAFDEFQSIDLAFDLAITPGEPYRGFNGR